MQFNLLLNQNVQKKVIVFLILFCVLLSQNFDLTWSHPELTLEDGRNSSDKLEKFQLLGEFKEVIPYKESLFQKEQELLINNLLPSLYKGLSEAQKNERPAYITLDPFPKLCETNYMRIRNEHLKLGDPHSVLNFVDDKLLTKQCLQKKDKGIIFTETVCEILIKMETSGDFENVWNTIIFPELKLCVESYFDVHKDVTSLFMKANHLSYGATMMVITEEHFNVAFEKVKLKNEVENKYFLDEESYKAKKAKPGSYWMDATPGIVVEPVVPLAPEELRFFTIFGRAEVVHFGNECAVSDSGKNVLLRGGIPLAQALFHRTTGTDSWVKNEIPAHWGDEKNRKQYEELQANCENYLKKIPNFKNIVKKVDLLGSMLHMDLVRIDVFLVENENEDQVWFNEIEIDAAIHVVGYETYILEKLEAGYKATEKNEFIPNEDAKDEFNPNCFDERTILYDYTKIKKIKTNKENKLEPTTTTIEENHKDKPETKPIEENEKKKLEMTKITDDEEKKPILYQQKSKKATKSEENKPKKTKIKENEKKKS